ncbi:small-subunit processome [Podospora fimiseda]|uniref:U3 small nucleolar RNA-associated protein 11 n=1 Tax=Podospora fimiseda TaxID=252190 RepID=A0AAN7BT49_9PEZI|nr:small-subunit processome [Podospora fimiseda]
MIPSVQRRSHRERAQPLERAKLGLLEKHKDYSKRAKDYKKKQTILKSLRQKAADRNEDEFYFGMMSRKGPGASITRGKEFDGKVHGERGNKAMDVDLVRLLKTQDLGYVRTLRSVVLKEVKGLEERWILAGGLDEEDEGWDSGDEEDGGGSGKKVKKIVFADGVEEWEAKLKREMRGDEYEDEYYEGMEGDDNDEKRQLEAERKAKNLEKLKGKLTAAKKKLKVLTEAERELGITQAKMAKTATSGGITKSKRRIKIRERKR